MTIPSVVALIPARSGSKRVKSKNIRPLNDHPLIAYTITAALQSRVFSAVMVSTDSEQIAAVARHYGADVPFLRPPEYATDTSPDIEWLEHMLRRLKDAGHAFDCFSLLRPTSPFRKPATIQRAWQEFLSAGEVDSLRAIEKVTQHPGKMWVINGNRITPLLLNPRGVPWHSTPYQTLPEVYAQNASLEIAWVRVVLEQHSIAGQVLCPFITQADEGYDINNEHDWILAEELLKRGQVTLPTVPQAAYRLE